MILHSNSATTERKYSFIQQFDDDNNDSTFITTIDGEVVGEIDGQIDGTMDGTVRESSTD